MATGATVLSKKVWDEITPADRAILEEEGRKLERDAESEIRHENVAALEAMKKKGLQEIPTPTEMTRDVAKRILSVAEKTAQGFSKDFQVEVAKLLEEYRRAHPEEL
jgi:TRAP-type C4-dicarboxylate transport system substrate-binding protein